MEALLPLTKDAIKHWRIGEVYELTGGLYTARDAAHARFAEAFNSGGRLPVDLANQTILYTGPAPAKPGFAIGPFGPTTSLRMDPYTDMMLTLGVTAMIGKGNRGDDVTRLCARHGAVYLLAIGGAAALYAACVNSVDVAAYDDLGTESVKRLNVTRFKVIVGIDATGAALQDREIPKYRR